MLPGPKPLSLGHALARLGLAKTQQFFDASRVKGGQELVAVVQAAKEARLKVCGGIQQKLAGARKYMYMYIYY